MDERKEKHIMQLAAISTASIQNTPSTASSRIGRENPYWSVACGDVCRAVDREMKLISQVEQLRDALKKIAEYDDEPIWNDDRDDAAYAMLDIARNALCAK